MRVLITGGTGYVGNAVVTELVRAGHQPRLLVRSPGTPVTGTESVLGDILDPASLVAACADTDAVVHLAALTRVRESFDQPARYHEVNASGTVNVIAALADSTGAAGRVPRLVLASTAGVYGSPVRQPISEDTPATPGSPYAASKWAAEQAVRRAAETGQITGIALRVFNVAGAWMGRGDRDETRIITRAVAAATGRVPHLEVFGDGRAVRDYVHVADVARAVVLAVETSTTGYAVFNVGATPVSVAEIIAATERVVGRAVPVVRRPAHPGEAVELRADTTRIRRALGWVPRRSALDDLVRDQWTAQR
ncbi:NAD-dependent epimerase/dehydratase family protein [Goodfellowiella coeruleoviolacea]|uniref:UDP-glucose 4-epimerase n=1 Tax=Goodfellowiella coeruleoviolacea TaxID=334858 RepID=A0AAE3GNR6_9PSEU|nr:NAD-dependent epimerase/dehydratase family protein [Goodfellowiella coeruleoviolacea]MCP2169393.1 UDP-glucose 4-epimerase [Goodfellowiella coeruleoviolacea]